MKTLTITNDNMKDAIVVVSAKEHGKLFTTQDGTLKILDYVAEHPPEYSDNEGFFATVNTGGQFSGGAPKEPDQERNLERYIKAISEELSAAVKYLQPKHIYVFEPEHLKGLVEEHLMNPEHIPVTVVAYGNFVEQGPEIIVERLNTFGADAQDPADLASVAGEENADEKRKILETSEQRFGHPE